MKITVLIENSTCREDLPCEHGLSLYIEACGKKILFDAGQTDAFAANAEALGIDLAETDLVILSHGHFDHSGGLLRFLQMNRTAPIYLTTDAFTPHFNGEGKYIGVDPALSGNPRLRYVDTDAQIAPGITLHTCNHLRRPYPFGNFGLTMAENGSVVSDTFTHEQYLLIEENGKRVCVSGCSHKGILNIVSWFRPDVLIGGFHFMKLDPNTGDAEQLAEAARKLLENNTLYYTGHCTGELPYAFLKARMRDRLNPLSTGTVITV